MCCQKLMNIHHCVFKKKNKGSRTDNVKTVYPTTNKVCGGIIILYMYIAPGQGHTTPWGQTFDVNCDNRKPLSLCPFVASLKKEI